MRSFEGSVAFVTGGASGIGRALGRALARRGAVAVLADRDLEPAEATAAAIREGGGHAEAAELDVRDAAAFERLAADVVERHGRIDYLFANAGIAIGGEVSDYGVEEWDRVVDVNLRGVTNGVQAVYRRMIGQGSGHIVATASTAGFVPLPGGAGYAASKHAVVGLCRSLRIEAARHGVRVSVLCPGAVQTPILVDGGRHGTLLKPVPRERQERLWRRLRPTPAARLAELALDAVARNRAIIVVPARWRLHWWLDRLSPALSAAVTKRLFERARREMWPESE